MRRYRHSVPMLKFPFVSMLFMLKINSPICVTPTIGNVMKLLKTLFLTQDNTRFGVSLAILSAAMLAINDVLVKFLLKELPFYEIIFIRSLIIILGLICLKEIGSKDGGQKNDL